MRRGSRRAGAGAQCPLRRALAGALVLLCAAPGCVVARYQDGNPIPLERLARIEPGVTTKAQVLEWFGPPRNYTSASVLEQLLASDQVPPGTRAPYRFSDVLAYQLHRGRARGLLLFFFNRIDVTMRSDHLVIFFDEDDRVLYHGVRRAEP